MENNGEEASLNVEGYERLRSRLDAGNGGISVSRFLSGL